jgi:hypothetical protein
LSSAYANAGPYTISRRVSAAAQGPKHVAVFNLGTAFANNSSVELIRNEAESEAELKKVQEELSQMKLTYLPAHPKVIAAEAQIKYLEAEINSQKAGIGSQTHDHIEQIKGILAQTLDSLGLNENVNVQFHSGANLLIVTGSDAALEVATKIMTAMGGRPGNELARDGLTTQTANPKTENFYRLSVASPSVDADGYPVMQRFAIETPNAGGRGAWIAATTDFDGTLGTQTVFRDATTGQLLDSAGPAVDFAKRAEDFDLTKQFEDLKTEFAAQAAELGRNPTPERTAALQQLITKLRELQAQLIQRGIITDKTGSFQSASGTQPPPPQNLAPAPPTPKTPPTPPQP